MVGVDAPDVPDQHRDVIRWNAGQLRHAHERLLSHWPATVRVKAPRGAATGRRLHRSRFE